MSQLLLFLTSMQTQTADIFLTPASYTRVNIFSQARQGLDEAKENLATSLEVGLGQRRPLLIDIRFCEPLSPEVRRYYSGQVLVDSFLAMALLIDSSAFGTMMGNVYLKISRPGIPTQLFTDENAAVDWLTGFLNG